MEPVHTHLLLSHFPVLGSLVAVPLLIYSLLRKSDELKQLSLIVLVLVALAAIPVYLTGEPAEEVVEKIAGVGEAVIEPHEDAAKIAMIFAMVTGAFSLLSLVLLRAKKELASWLISLSLLLSIGSALMMARVANLGGQIRHSEIRAGDIGAPATEKTKSERKTDDHDED